MFLWCGLRLPKAPFTLSTGFDYAGRSRNPEETKLQQYVDRVEECNYHSA